MTRFIGLDYLDTSTFTGIMIMMVVAGVVAGWISDAIMGSSGYGMIGNSCLTLLGAFTGLAGWRHFIGPILPRDTTYIMATAGGCALAILVLFSLFKRAVR